jgi:hypothetical protein
MSHFVGRYGADAGPIAGLLHSLAVPVLAYPLGRRSPLIRLADQVLRSLARVSRVRELW